MLDSAHMKKDTSYTASVKELPKSQVEITVEIPWETVAPFETIALDKLRAELDLPGFRKGSVPADIARKHIPNHILLSDMAEHAINSVYPAILSEHKLDVIGRPEVAITKLARSNPLAFTVTAAVFPTIKLPNYKKLALEIAAPKAQEVGDSDVERVLGELQQVRAYGHVHSEGDNHEHSEPLPELNDEFAASFGPFKSIDELRVKIKENLLHEAGQAARDKRRVAIMDKIVAETTFEIPDVIIKSETDKMFATIENDLARSGATFDEYLKHINKTKEQLVEEFKPEAEKRGRFQFILNAIARDAAITPTEADIEAEAQKFMNLYPTADHSRTKAYAEMMLTNEKVLALLEGK